MSSFGFENARPMLTEPGVKYFISETLKQCHHFKETHQNMIFNIGLLIQLLLFREDAHNKASFFQFENIPIFEFANRGN
jgi:hypothetical protein